MLPPLSSSPLWLMTWICGNYCAKLHYSRTVYFFDCQWNASSSVMCIVYTILPLLV